MRGFCPSNADNNVEPDLGRPDMKWNVVIFIKWLLTYRGVINPDSGLVNRKIVCMLKSQDFIGQQ